MPDRRLDWTDPLDNPDNEHGPSCRCPDCTPDHWIHDRAGDEAPTAEVDAVIRRAGERD